MKTKWMTWICIVAAGMAASVAYGISYNPEFSPSPPRAATAWALGSPEILSSGMTRWR